LNLTLVLCITKKCCPCVVPRYSGGRGWITNSIYIQHVKGKLQDTKIRSAPKPDKRKEIPDELIELILQKLFVRNAGSTFLNDLSSRRIEFRPSLNIRLTRGLSFDVFGQYRNIIEQISLPGRNQGQRISVLKNLQIRLLSGASHMSGS